MAIISHRHQFIFLKTRKTAGTSIEILLANICGPEDMICTSDDAKEFGVSDQNNKKKFKDLDFFDFAKTSTRAFKNIFSKGHPDLNKSLCRLKNILKTEHTTVKNMKAVCGEDLFKRYYKFCFERNPFDRLVSLYHWRTKDLKIKPSFRDFVLTVIEKYTKKNQKIAKADFWTNRPFYELDEEIVLDKVCRFENLTQEIDNFYKMIGISWDGQLPFMKSGNRPTSDYREYYTPELIQLCKEIYSFEINTFGYEF